MQIKEQSLKDALNAARLLELPKQYRNDDDGFWLKSVALVRKRDCTQSYCLVEHKADGRILYKRDFGTMSPIIGLVALYPYIYLDRQFLPAGTIAEKRDTLAVYIGGDEAAKTAVQAMSDEEVELEIREIAIATQYDADVLTEANKAVSKLVHNPEPAVEDGDDNEPNQKDYESDGDCTGGKEADSNAAITATNEVEENPPVGKTRGRKPGSNTKTTRKRKE